MSNTSSICPGWFIFLVWGMGCFAQPSSTSPRLDVSLLGGSDAGHSSADDEGKSLPAQLSPLDSGLHELEFLNAEIKATCSATEEQYRAIQGSADRLTQPSEKDTDIIKKRLIMIYKFAPMGYAAPLVASEDMASTAAATRKSLSLLQSDRQVF